MSEKEILKIINMYDKSGKLSKENYLKKHYPDVLKYIKNFAIKYNLNDIPIYQIKWHIKNNIYTIPVCKNCKKQLKFKQNIKRYPTFCSNKCSTIHTDTKQKVKTTMLKKYNVTHSSLTNKSLINRHNKKINTIKKHYEKHHVKITNYNSNDEFFIGYCTKHKKEFKMSLSVFYNRYSKHLELCGVCMPYKYSSNIEIEITNIFEKLNINYIRNNRTILNGLELDIYLPDYNLAFEINGLYWHSELYKNKFYHTKKLNLALKNNIKLIQIWEDDWYFKNNAVKNKIKILLNKLTLHNIKKCKIKEINNLEYKEFLNNYDINKYIPVKIKIGLFYNNILINVLGIRITKKDKIKSKINYKVCNFAEKYHIYNGLNLMFNYFVIKYNPNSIVAYENLDFGYEHKYLQLGFKLEKQIKYSYSYIIHKKRVNSYMYNKKYNNKYYKIYNTGYLKYIWIN